MKKTCSLPVLMYHYISDHENSIAVSPEHFEDHCCTLAEKGWKGVSLEEAEQFFLTGEPLPPKSFLITFDDGYLDNYIYAMPILQRYGHKGVMFAVANRIEQSDTLRALPEDLFLGKKPDTSKIDCPVCKDELGYLRRCDIFCNRAELRAMVKSGVMQVASHSFGHFGVFTSDAYQDFSCPENQIRTFYRTEDPWIWGMPKFPVGPALAHRAFLPSQELKDALLTHVPQNIEEANDFFVNGGKKSIIELLAGLKEGIGRFETNEEKEHRVQREIVKGKELLEELVEHPITTLCWPWGAWTEFSRDIAKEAGFTVFLTTQEGINLPCKNDAVHRFKAKDKPGSWLLSRVRIYSHPLAGKIYAKIRM